MELVRVEFNNLHLPMMEDEKRMIYATNRVLALAVGMEQENLWDAINRMRSRLTPLRPSFDGLREFLNENKVEFGIKRVRKDMLVWPFQDIVRIAAHVKTPQADQFHNVICNFAIENARRSVVTREEYRKLEQELAELRALITQAQPGAAEAAAAASAALRAQRGTRYLRLVQ